MARPYLPTSPGPPKSSETSGTQGPTSCTSLTHWTPWIPWTLKTPLLLDILDHSRNCGPTVTLGITLFRPFNPVKLFKNCSELGNKLSFDIFASTTLMEH